MRKPGFTWILVVAAALTSWGQAPARPTFDFEFAVMATERLRDFGYVQLKPEAAAKVRPTAADFDILPLRVNSQGRSDLVRFRGPGPLRFVRTQGRGEAMVVERVLATVVQPASRGRSLFLLVPGAGEAWEVVALDDDVSVFPARHIRVVNLAGEALAVSFNGQARQYGAEPRMEAPRPLSGNLKLGVAMERQGRAVPVFDQTLSVGDDERVLVVFLPPFRPGADVRTRVVRDTVARPPAADE